MYKYKKSKFFEHLQKIQNTISISKKKNYLSDDK